MKRNHTKLLVTALLIAAMALSMVGCGGDQVSADAIDPEYVAQLEQECIDLRNQLQALNAQIGDLEQAVALKSSALKAVPNDDNSGASVEITAVPTRYQEGMTALFKVTLNGQEVSNAEGSWDGTAFTASVGLKAADGYSYECVLTRPDGTTSNVIISSPELPIYESCVYLQAGMNAYCNMIAEDSAIDGDQLVLVTGYVQVQLPRIGSHTISYKSSDLVLKNGDQELQRVKLEIPEGEVKGSYEMALENIRFDIPEDSDGQELNLWLEVVLSNDQVLSYNGCSWTVQDGELVVSAG